MHISYYAATLFFMSTLCLIDDASSNVSMESSSSLQNIQPMSQKETPMQRPLFDDISPHNVTAVVGQTAILHCRVKHVSDRTVSWMRKRDLHILTSSIHTYTGDGRFSVVHPENSEQWDLKVEFVQKRDAGIYECQVNTEPKINLAVQLNVEGTAQANIHGPPEVFVKKGSTISLTCSVNVHSTPPSSVVWLHGTKVVDFDSPRGRGGISLETEKTESGTTSRLLVTKAGLSDTGNYTCQPSNANTATVFVHVLNGEHPAAMQHGEHGAGSKLAAWSWTLTMAAFALSYR
ncbi:zwei Ig domain protein zig-8-like isoform X1 [Acyrthosiphon pisum]|uniref:Ig-like domain-containing protein n=2 Tax=Acyrthosiphon pisum TaxID=7029 RepID=A0A8R2B9B9_ACYPI|nr:zwei Ig domain protein zig-8-like isoform X1 [Acyrthosiphon pisum]|eukprot:XP_008187242.1 PREDICTED: protein sidekick-1-like isoform X1 [Acyrthosiphon pisum]